MPSECPPWARPARDHDERRDVSLVVWFCGKEKQAGSRIRMLGAASCRDTRRARRLLDRVGVFLWFSDVEMDAEVEARNGGERPLPTVVFAGGSFVTEPSDAELLDLLELPEEAA
jgi:glutaredoxin